jgi:hypothetical protein
MNDIANQTCYGTIYTVILSIACQSHTYEIYERIRCWQASLSILSIFMYYVFKFVTE